MATNKIPYTIDSIPINTNGQSVEANCIDVMFINYGTTTLNINNSIKIPPPATPGEFNSITISANQGEIDVTKYVCKFTGGGVNDALIVRRNYR